VESCAIDGIPIIGKIEAAENLIFGFAWSGHGFAIAPGVVAYLADWIMGGEEPAELAPFSPRRFRGAGGS
jgi:glycine/D-amino acid oxidase-like deaminating enzyme